MRFRAELQRNTTIAATALVAAIVSTSAEAHDFLLRYRLPVPFNLYLYACGATLIVTFFLFGWFMRAPGGVATAAPGASDAGNDRESWAPVKLPPALVAALQTAALLCLLLTVVAGLIGTRDPDHNISLVLFWQIFLLGLTYATAFIGDIYDFVNPWRVLAVWVRGGEAKAAASRFQYPENWGYVPALVFYLALIWIELFTHAGPRAIAIVLMVYTVINVAGARLFGAPAWFCYGEVFSVFLRIVGTLAPVRYRSRDDGKGIEAHFRWPLTGTLDERPQQITLVLFILFMLASTTFDGIHQTVFWMGLYWNGLLPLLHPLWGNNLLAVQTMLERWYVVYQQCGLVLSPFFYLAIYTAVMAAVKRITRTALSVRNLALAFAFTVVPIAFVYNMTHYYTLLLTQVPLLPHFLTDPFGYGWNPLGLPKYEDMPILDVAAVWHTEVALILIGHVASVYLAHKVALRLFVDRRQAMLSQLPMLLLMVGYTVIGLWVISLPFVLN